MYLRIFKNDYNLSHQEDIITTNFFFKGRFLMIGAIVQLQRWQVGFLFHYFWYVILLSLLAVIIVTGNRVVK